MITVNQPRFLQLGTVQWAGPATAALQLSEAQVALRRGHPAPVLRLRARRRTAQHLHGSRPTSCVQVALDVENSEGRARLVKARLERTLLGQVGALLQGR